MDEQDKISRRRFLVINTSAVVGASAIAGATELEQKSRPAPAQFSSPAGSIIVSPGSGNPRWRFRSSAPPIMPQPGRRRSRGFLLGRPRPGASNPEDAGMCRTG